MKNKSVKIESLKILLRYVFIHNTKVSICSLLLSTIETIASIAFPFLIGSTIDTFTSNGITDAFYSNIALMLFATVITATSGYLSGYLNNVVGQLVVKQIRNELMTKLQKLSVPYTDSISRGDLLSRMTNDVELIGDGVTQGMNQFFSCIVTVITTMGFMFFLNSYVALSIVVLTPFSILTTASIVRKCRVTFKRQQQNLGSLSGLTDELISEQKLIVAYNYAEIANDRFEKSNEMFRESSMSANFFSSLSNPVTRFINNIAYLTAGIIGVYLRLSVGTIGGFLIYAARFARPFNDIGNVLPQLQAATAATTRVFEILSAPVEIDNSTEILDPTKISCKIVFKDVRFSYTKDVPFINNLNLVVNPGKKIAVVGRTGSGKTTLVNLLLRFYEIDAGQILVGDIDIRSVSIDSLRRCFGMVLQDTWLMNESIRYNIAYSRPTATLDEVITAAKAAQCHDFIMQTDNGYDTILGKNYDDLSEGQRQLICIARVMLENAPMLILDEATSSIDTRTEKLIDDAFDNMTKNKTAIIIAHRLSTIQNADYILVLDKGSIAEVGTHLELLMNNGIYSKLYQAQFAQPNALVLMYN
ncbi:MAG: ABC transporter ATP-binding protein/permease [Christensenellaceae bacterium]|jgi:ATP-binding cassette subfamily B protein|nr:ABC transporter ATP-binding protein/permease [Christensenellaceae bacterium]